jgi:SM-20-related protein
MSGGPATAAPAPQVRVYDNVLGPNEHAAVWNFLRGPGWSYGGYSADEGDRYFYKHFAGFVADGQEARAPAANEAELAAQAPLIAQFWQALKTSVLKDEQLARCYANGMPPGVEGSLHLDSNVESHLTAIYYPHGAWNPNLGGETLMFNPAGDEIVAAVYPRPNRLAVFSGVIPHVARPLSHRAPDLRITLMFKTLGPETLGPAG